MWKEVRLRSNSHIQSEANGDVLARAPRVRRSLRIVSSSLQAWLVVECDDKQGDTAVRDLRTSLRIRRALWDRACWLVTKVRKTLGKRRMQIKDFQTSRYLQR
jgi:hypothetical protein